MLVYDLKYWFMGNMFSNLFKFLATFMAILTQVK